MYRFLTSLLLATILATPLWSAEKKALLIGINNYLRAGDEWDLKGCLNDVEMTQQMLITKFQFPRENIKTLLDEQATAANIVQAIEEWLIADSKPGDIVYFHFSGHGSQMRDWDGDEEDGKDELLCPADMQPGVRRTVITDDQLGELLARVQAHNITVVLDACHSGTGTRDSALSRSRYMSFEPGEKTLHLQETRSATTRTDVLNQRSLDKLSGSGGMESGFGSQVTISGCKPEQTSADAWISDGYYAGALTYNLVENIKKASPNTTYRQLLESVARDIKADQYRQIPQIEGNIDQPLLSLGTTEVTAVPFVLIESVQDSTVILNAGQAQGLTSGSIYAVYPDSETSFVGSSVGRVRITEVHQTRAEALVLDGGEISPGQLAKEIAHKLDEDLLKILVEGGDAALRQEVSAILETLDFVAVATSSERFDNRLQLGRSALGLQGVLTIDGAPGALVTTDSAEDLIAALHPQLEHSFVLKHLAELENDTPAFAVEVWANHSRNLALEPLDQMPDEKLVQASIDDAIRFNFKANRDCYLTMVNVGPLGEITILFPNRYRRTAFIEGGKVYRTETSGEMPFRIRTKAPAGREMVKVIASLQPLDLSGLTSGQLNGMEITASGSRFSRQLRHKLAQVLAGSGEATLPSDQWASDYLIVDTVE